MTSRVWCAAALFGATVACSSASQGFHDLGGGGGPDPSSSGDDGGSGSSSGDQSNQTDLPPSYDAGLAQYVAPIKYSDAAAKSFYDTSVPDAELAQSATLTITPFTVAPGAEVYMCQWFANPFGGQDVDIVEIDGQMSEGSHHFFVFNMATDTDQTT